MKAISTDKAPAAIGPYSQGIEICKLVFVSGQLPIIPEKGVMPDTIEEQTAQSLRNISGVLEQAGLDMSSVVKTTVFIADLNDFAAMNGVYETFFEAPYPTRSCVQVAAIPKGAKLEIECIAKKS